MHVVNKHSGCKTSRIFPRFSYILKLQKAWCCPSRCRDVCSCFSVLGLRTGSKAWPCTVTSITLFHCNIEIMWLPISSKEQLKMVPAEEESHRERRRLSSQPAGSLFLQGWKASFPEQSSLYTGIQKHLPKCLPEGLISFFSVSYKVKQPKLCSNLN